MSKLSPITLPAFGREDLCPEIPVDIYRRRLAATAEALPAAGIDVLAVFADREHSANLAWLTGFDPRFEEALLLLTPDGQGSCKKLLLAGNECMGYLPDPALNIPVELFQSFSLMGQPRDRSRPLRAILADFGLRNNLRVGAACAKYFDADPLALDIPSYLADSLRSLTGRHDLVSNAAPLFMHPRTGLRLVNEPEQIAFCEYAASVASDGILALLKHIQVGAREGDLERHLDSRGLPLSCHRMLSFGPKAARGLSSPGNTLARLGDPYTTAFGVLGALSCRAGVVAGGPEELPPSTRSVFPALASNYFDVVAAWYSSLRVGASADDVFAKVDSLRAKDLYSFAVNPGHYLGLEEWLHSPFFPGSTLPLPSGCLLQMDIIPISSGPLCCINSEDGLALADASLRSDLQRLYPSLWRRIQLRRAFMQNTLGIPLDPSVLPLGNTPAWLPPYVLALDKALTA